MIDDKTLVETFAREFEATKSLDRAVMAVANAVRAKEFPEPIQAVVSATKAGRPARKPKLPDLSPQASAAIDAVAANSGIERDVLFNRVHGWRRHSRERWLCWVLMRRLGMKWAAIGRVFGCHHTAIIEGFEQVERDVGLSARAKTIWEQFTAQCAVEASGIHHFPVSNSQSSQPQTGLALMSGRKEAA